MNRIKSNRILNKIAWTASVTAIAELALSQLSIKMTRLSSVETTGISLFAFIIFSLVTLFAVTRMKENAGGKIFAAAMNFATSLAAAWYLLLIFSDRIFFRSLYYTLNRQTQNYELLPAGERIFASVPLALIIAGALIYLACGITILAAALSGGNSGE